MSAPFRDKMLIVDFGSQVTQLIARRFRRGRRLLRDPVRSTARTKISRKARFAPGPQFFPAGRPAPQNPDARKFRKPYWIPAFRCSGFATGSKF